MYEILCRSYAFARIQPIHRRALTRSTAVLLNGADRKCRFTSTSCRKSFNNYQPTMSFWNIFDTTWEGLRNLFKQKRFLRTLRSSCFLKNQMEVWWNLLEQILEGLHGGGSLGTPPFGDKSKPFRIMERHFQDVSKQQQISKSYWHHIRYPLVP